MYGLDLGSSGTSDSDIFASSGHTSSCILILSLEVFSILADNNDSVFTRNSSEVCIPNSITSPLTCLKLALPFSLEVEGLLSSSFWIVLFPPLSVDVLLVVERLLLSFSEETVALSLESSVKGED